MKSLKIAVLFPLAAVLTHAAFAAAPVPRIPKGMKVVKASLNGEERLANQLRVTGGIVAVPETGSGHVSVLNLQTRMSDRDIDIAIALIRNTDFGFAFRREAEPKVEAGGNRYERFAKVLKSKALVIIVDDPEEPALLAAPESGWAVMNVAALEAGLKTPSSKEKFFRPRCRKQFIRAFCYASGTGGSTFKDNLMTVHKIPEMDFIGEFIPADTKRAVKNNLKARGIEPQELRSYVRACAEGIAPAPTNEQQKVIWEKAKAEANAKPTNPMRITKEAK